MHFQAANLTDNYPLLRYVSEGGQWEVGLVPMLFGVRVRAGRTDDPFTVALDYCAGADLKLQRQLLIAVIVIFTGIPEAATHRDVHRLFPECHVKPIDRDPSWEIIVRMRDDIMRQAMQAQA